MAFFVSVAHKADANVKRELHNFSIEGLSLVS
jgi:hypothetical protein